MLLGIQHETHFAVFGTQSYKFSIYSLSDNDVEFQASNDQPAAYLHGNSNAGTKSSGKVVVLLQFKKYIQLMHFWVVDCNQAALLRTGILVAVSGILLF